MRKPAADGGLQATLPHPGADRLAGNAEARRGGTCGQVRGHVRSVEQALVGERYEAASTKRRRRSPISFMAETEV
jgi:hypothetical protein